MEDANPGADSPVNPGGLSPIKRKGNEVPYPLTAAFRHVLRVQNSNDRRMFPARWYFRLDVQKVRINKTYREADETVRAWLEPVPSAFYVNHEPTRKELDKFGVERKVGLVTCRVSEAERLRVGELLGLSGNSLLRFQMTPGDLFMFKDELYEVRSFSEDEFYGTSERTSVWKMLAGVYRFDSSARVSPVTIPADKPEVTPWRPATLK